MFWSCKELPLSLLSRCAGVAWRSAHSLSSLLCVEALRTWQYVFAPPLFHLLLFFFLFLLLTVAPTGLQDAILDGIYGNSTLIFSLPWEALTWPLTSHASFSCHHKSESQLLVYLLLRHELNTLSLWKINVKELAHPTEAPFLGFGFEKEPSEEQQLFHLVFLNVQLFS